jgi:nuclear transport factor 2 (NTF2) superfamily protein
MHRWSFETLQNWEFDERGLMRRREASINDLAIKEEDRKFRWERT